MSSTAVAVAIMAGITFHVGFYHLLVYRQRRDRREDLMFAFSCFAMACYDMFSIGMSMAPSAQAGLIWQQAQMAGIGLVSIFVLLFLAEYTGMVDRKWRRFFMAFFVIAILLQALNPGRLMWHASDPVVKTIRLPWNEVVVYNEVAPGLGTELTGLVGIILIAYFFSVACRYGRAGNRQRALPLMASCILILSCIASDVGVMSGKHAFIYTTEYGYMALVLLMTFSMARQVVEAAGMKDALEKSQGEIISLNQNLELMVEERTAKLTEANEMLKVEIEVRSTVEKNLNEALEKIKTMSVTDALTGCFNRAYLIEHLPHEIRCASRYRYPFSVIMCDIDFFKRINDAYGHRAGDEVLKAVVKKIEGIIRDNVDWVSRYGGEEFVLALLHTDLAGGLCLAERIRRAIAELEIAVGDDVIRVTASFGVACFDPAKVSVEMAPDEIIDQADLWMYAAKQAGRNCVRPVSE